MPGYLAVFKDWEGKWAVSERTIYGAGLRYLMDKSDPAIFAEEMPEIYADYLKYSEDYYAYMENLEEAFRRITSYGKSLMKSWITIFRGTRARSMWRRLSRRECSFI